MIILGCTPNTAFRCSNICNNKFDTGTLFSAIFNTPDGKPNKNYEVIDPNAQNLSHEDDYNPDAPEGPELS